MLSHREPSRSTARAHPERTHNCFFVPRCQRVTSLSLTSLPRTHAEQFKSPVREEKLRRYKELQSASILLACKAFQHQPHFLPESQRHLPMATTEQKLSKSFVRITLKSSANTSGEQAANRFYAPCHHQCACAGRRTAVPSTRRSAIQRRGSRPVRLGRRQLPDDSDRSRPANGCGRCGEHSGDVPPIRCTDCCARRRHRDSRTNRERRGAARFLQAHESNYGTPTTSRSTPGCVLA